MIDVLEGRDGLREPPESQQGQIPGWAPGVEEPRTGMRIRHHWAGEQLCGLEMQVAGELDRASSVPWGPPASRAV